MAAATVSTTLASNGPQTFESLLQHKQFGIINIQNRPSKSFMFDSGDQTILSTQTNDVNDRTLLFQFPAKYGAVYIEDLAVTVSTALDAHATPTVVFSILTYDTADLDVYIATTTIGQAGGTKELDAATGFKYKKDVSGKYLCLKITTGSATAQAGVVRVRGKIYVGSPITLS